MYGSRPSWKRLCPGDVSLLTVHQATAGCRDCSLATAYDSSKDRQVDPMGLSYSGSHCVVADQYWVPSNEHLFQQYHQRQQLLTPPHAPARAVCFRSCAMLWRHSSSAAFLFSTCYLVLLTRAPRKLLTKHSWARVHTEAVSKWRLGLQVPASRNGGSPSFLVVWPKTPNFSA